VPPGYAPTVVSTSSPTVHTHDGFYLRLHVGPAFTKISGTDSFGTTTEYSGGGASLGISMGGALSDSVVLFGTALGSAADNALVKTNGFNSGHLDGSINVFGLGGGMAYYFVPHNVFISGALMGMTFQLADSQGKDYYTTKSGLGAELMIGKEWWVSDNWGIGLAGEVIGASMKDKDDDTLKWSSSSFGVVLSATYN
jgi:hypothetical protein